MEAGLSEGQARRLARRGDGAGFLLHLSSMLFCARRAQAVKLSDHDRSLSHVSGTELPPRVGFLRCLVTVTVRSGREATLPR